MDCVQIKIAELEGTEIHELCLREQLKKKAVRLFELKSITLTHCSGQRKPTKKLFKKKGKTAYKQ